MTTTITTKAQEESTFTINMAFTDSASNSVAPTAVLWTLMDKNSNVINEREEIAIGAGDLAASIDVVLSGDDLAIQIDEVSPYDRYLLVEATYDGVEGSNKPLRDRAKFNIENLAEAVS